MTDTAEALHVSNLHKRFGALEVLKGVSLTAKQGDVIAIIGGSGNDTLRIDEDSFGGNTLPKVISFYGGDGDDNVVFDSSFDISSKVAWTLDGDGAGSVRGTRVGVDFHETENLRGSDDNEDTFTIKAAGSLAGTIDGGFGGNDTIVYDGVAAVADSAVLGANGSGSVGLNNHSTLVFENMEPFAVGGGVTIEDHSGVAKGKDVAITVSDGKLHLSIGGGPLSVAYDPVSKLAYVSSRDAGTVTAVDAEGKIVGNLDQSPFPNHVFADGKGGVYSLNKSMKPDDPKGDRITHIQFAR